MKDKFELGREYERTNRTKNFLIFMGYGLIFFGGFWFFSAIIGKNTLWQGLILLGLGCMSLYAGYSEKKELEKLNQEKGK